MSDQPIRIDRSDLFSSAVEEYLESRESLRRALEDVAPRPLLVRIFLSSWFYLAIASGTGAFIGWAMLEPSFNDREMITRLSRRALRQQGPEISFVALLLFPVVSGAIGLFLGAAEGIMCRNLRRAATAALVGVAVGFFGACVLVIPANLLYGLLSGVAERMAFPNADIEIQRQVMQWQAQGLTIDQIANKLADRALSLKMTGFPLLLQMVGRSLGWAVFGMAAGIGQGIAMREKRVIINGLVGGLLGGMFGGLLFDPIAMFLRTDLGDAWLSRGVGCTLIGLLVGLFVGLVEGWTKTAWLLMQKGPLAGKQFVIYRETTVLGSSPRADIYLFKDDAIEPRHALIHNRGGRFEIEDLDTPDGTYVNGIPVHRQLLQPGDQIVLGRTVLEFSIRETG